jgi:hypothetical protein
MSHWLIVRQFAESRKFRQRSIILYSEDVKPKAQSLLEVCTEILSSIALERFMENMIPEKEKLSMLKWEIFSQLVKMGNFFPS